MGWDSTVRYSNSAEQVQFTLTWQILAQAIIISDALHCNLKTYYRTINGQFSKQNKENSIMLCQH